MSDFYAEMAADVVELLTEFGRPVTVTIAAPDPVYDPATSTNVNPTVDYPAVGAKFDLNDREINGTLVQVGDKRVYVSAVGVPEIRLDDRVTLKGVNGAPDETYRVVNPNTIGPAGTAVLYDLHVRK
ncbi:hypothetical protein WI89_00805 [Burkholderia ubonensis]|uniref:hypothetical protein n=1 Tax=Burkholderia ubonensis TaxID=101571 RepID=UPI0007592A11|nr:hypothetical protein [Burkholderia ubonensis]KVD71793.1 hypothetical protein WI89_00805 [Burkholderia ubonensis]KVT92705.1 hypothetical protein WK60_14035 [Burkholderia ubonensis]